MKELIDQFEASVKQEFLFLQSEYNFIIRDIQKYSTCISMFYETQFVTVKLVFSARDHEVRIYVALKKPDNQCDTQLSNEELLRFDQQETNMPFTVFKTSNLINRIKDLSSLLKKYGKPYLLGERNAYVKLYNEQSNLNIKYQLTMQMNEIRENLNKMWANKDYNKIVLLLRPWLSFLKPSELKKYEYALRKIKGVKNLF